VNRRSSVKALLAVLVLAVLAACTPSQPAAPPSGAAPDDHKVIPWRPEDAPSLVAQLRALRDDPEFIESLDPDHRAEALKSIDELTTAPDAVEQVADYIKREGEAAEAVGGKPRPRPTPEVLEAAGAPSDIVAGKFDEKLPPPQPPAPKEETPPAQATIGSLQVDQPEQADDEGAAELTVEDTGRRWPEGSPNAWPITGGTKAEALSRLLHETEDDDASRSVHKCNVPNTGQRDLPSTPIDPYKGKIFTPTQDAWLNKSTLTSAHPGVDQIETRVRADGVRQFKVEAHMLSPIEDPSPFITGQMSLSVFKPHFVVERLGETTRSYFEGDPGTDINVLCYKQDGAPTNPTPVEDAKRGYVEAWLPLQENLDPLGNAGVYGEPGFQVRMETVDRGWCTPQPCSNLVAFYAASQATVHVAAPPPAHNVVTSGGVGVHVDDGLLVDRDGNTTNDLESAIKGAALPAVGSALESFQETYLLSPPPLPGAFITDVDANDIRLDMELDKIPISNAKDDEREFRVTFDIKDVYLEALIGIGIPCYFHTHLKGSLEATATVDIDANPQAIKLNVDSRASNLGTWGTFVLPWPPLCNIIYLLLSDLVFDWLEDQANSALNTAIDDALSSPLDLNLDDILAPGVTLPSGTGFGVNFAGFEQTCQPRGCDGGDIMMDHDGLKALAALGMPDKKIATAIRRFKWVYSPRIDDNPTELVQGSLTPAGGSYAVGAFVHPVVLNQMLRSLVEGSTAAPNGLLDFTGSVGGTAVSIKPEVAPIFVNQNYGPEQHPLTLFVPDLRIKYGNYQLTANVAVGVDLSIDSVTRKLTSTLQVVMSFDTLSCPWTLYATCANHDWMAGATPGIPGLATSLPGFASWAATNLIDALVSNSIGQVEIPPTDGFDLVGLGDLSVQNAGGTLGVYIGRRNAQAEVDVTADVNGFAAVAEAQNFFGGGPLMYDFRVEDMVSHTVYDPPPSPSPTFSVPNSGFDPIEGILRSGKVDVTITQPDSDIAWAQTVYETWVS
jgi:hypothetical protein